MGEAGAAVGGVGRDDSPLEKGSVEAVQLVVLSQIHRECCEFGREEGDEEREVRVPPIVKGRLAEHTERLRVIYGLQDRYGPGFNSVKHRFGFVLSPERSP